MKELLNQPIALAIVKSTLILLIAWIVSRVARWIAFLILPGPGPWCADLAPPGGLAGAATLPRTLKSAGTPDR